MSDVTDQPYPNNLDIVLPEPYLTAIGRVCVQWAQLEVIVDLTIRKMLGFGSFDPRATAVTAHMTWPLKMDVLSSLVAAYRPELPTLAAFERVGPMLRKAQEGRNRIIHASWGYEDGTALILRATARGKVKTSMDSVSVTDIAMIVDDIGAAGAELLKMVILR